MRTVKILLLFFAIFFSTDALAVSITKNDILEILGELESIGDNKEKGIDYIKKYFTDNYVIKIDIMSNSNKKDSLYNEASKQEILNSANFLPKLVNHRTKIKNLSIKIARDRQSADISYNLKDTVTFEHGLFDIQKISMNVTTNADCTSHIISTSKPYPLTDSGYCKVLEQISFSQ